MLTNNCSLCPRECFVDRSIKAGACGSTNRIKVARAALHMWEEPCISGDRGSGTVFFSGCPLHCVYCQNRKISDGSVGKELSVAELADTFIDLQNKGAHNINLVTPTHYIHQIREAIIMAKKTGLIIPIVYNTGGYEKVESLKLLSGLIDIYLPDLKYFSMEVARKYSNAPNYFEVALKAINEMYEQVGEATFDEEGLMTKGVIIRHLLLPGLLEDSKKIIKKVYEMFGDNVYLSIMNQYTPMQGIGEKFPELAYKVSEEDYDILVDYAIEIGVENGFIQEGETALESFIPGFYEDW